MDKPMIQQYTAIYEAYRAEMGNFCRSRLDDTAQTEDCVQQIFLALYEAMARGTELREPRAWLYKTARFVTARVNEKRRKERARFSDTSLEDAAGAASISFERCRLDMLEPAEEERLLALVLSRLSREEQEMIEAVYRHHMKHEELGQRMGLKRNTVSQKLKRLRLKVERLVEESVQD